MKAVRIAFAIVLCLGCAPGVAFAQEGAATALAAGTKAASTYQLKCGLVDGFVLKGSEMTFWVSATRDGRRMNSGFELFREGDDVPLDTRGRAWPEYADSAKETWYLNMSAFPAGNYRMRLWAGSPGEQGAVSRDYRMVFKKVPEGGCMGYATVSLEAFVLGLGYLAEPVRVPLFNGHQNAAEVVEGVLDGLGYTHSSTGDTSGGYYLARVGNLSHSMENVVLDETVARGMQKDDEYSFDARDYREEDGLGEFDFTNGSGWMYSVNGNFPNVGFSEYRLNDGDVLRVQYSLALGSDIGAAGSTGGARPDWYAVADRTEATELLGRINSAMNAEAIKDDAGAARRMAALELALGSLGSSQEDVDDACDALVAYLRGTGGYSGLSLSASKLSLSKGETAQLVASVAATESLMPQVVEWDTDDATVATVDMNGNVMAHGGGQAHITATLGASTATCTVEVPSADLEDFRVVPYAFPLNEFVRYTANIEKLQQDGAYLLKAGESVVLQVLPEPSYATAGLSVGLMTSDAAVAQPLYNPVWWDEDNKHTFHVNAVGKGEATICVRIGDIAREVRVKVVDDGVTGIRTVEDDAPDGERVATTSVVLYANDHSSAYHDWVGIDIDPGVDAIARDSQGTSFDVGDPSLVDAKLVRATKVNGSLTSNLGFYRLHLMAKGRAGMTDVRVRLGTYTAVVHVTVVDSQAAYARGVTAGVWNLSQAATPDAATSFSGNPVSVSRTVVGGTGGIWDGKYDGLGDYRYKGIDGVSFVEDEGAGSDEVTISVDDPAGILTGAPEGGSEVVQSSYGGANGAGYVSRSYGYAGGTGTASVCVSSAVGEATWSYTVADEVVPVASMAVLDPGGETVAQGANPVVPTSDGSGSLIVLPPAGVAECAEGDTLELSCSVAGEDGAEPTAKVVWYSDNPYVARVNAWNGLVSGIRGGRATVYAVCGGWVAQVEVTVTRAAESISMARDALVLSAGDTAQMLALVEPWYATDAVTWESSDPSVATVDSSGYVSAVGAGMCTVTASTAGGHSATCEISVAANPLRDAWFERAPYKAVRGSSFELSDDLRFRTADGKDATPDLGAATWWTSDEAVATVDSAGRVSAVGAGTCAVYCAVDGALARCPLTVSVPVESLSMVLGSDGSVVGEEGLEITNGQSATVRADVLPADTTDLLKFSWASSRENCVYVELPTQDWLGNRIVNLVGLRPGTALVTVSLGSVSVTRKVTVVRTPAQQAVFDMQQAVSLFAAAYPDLSASGLKGEARASCVDSADSAVAMWEGLSDELRGQVPEYADVFTSEVLAAVEDVRAALAIEAVLHAAASGEAADVAAARAAYEGLSAEQKAYVDAAATEDLAAGEAALDGKTNLANATVSVAAATYTGAAVKPAVTVKLAGRTLSAGRDFTVSWSGNVSAGSAAKATVKGIGAYHGSKAVSFAIAKASNSATAAKAKVTKKLKASKLKKKAVKVALPKVTCKFGKAAWKVAKKDKKKVLKLKSGKVVVKKGAKKGTYTIKLRAQVAGTSNYAAAQTKVVTVKVVVK